MVVRIGGAGGETIPIAALGSIVLATPLARSYPAGSPVDVYPPVVDNTVDEAAVAVDGENNGFGGLAAYLPSLPPLALASPLFGTRPRKTMYASLPVHSLISLITAFPLYPACARCILQCRRRWTLL